jgi:CheY-like chemotaxis protein
MHEQSNSELEEFSGHCNAIDIGKSRGIRNVRLIPKFAEEFGLSLPLDLLHEERYISPNQAGKIMNVTGEAVKQWIYSHRLPATKMSNGYWRIKVSDFEHFIKARHEVGKRRVLIVDDPTGNEAQFAVELDGLGHDVVFANSMADAFLKAADLNPALFILNVSMKACEVWKLAVKLRNTRCIKNVPLLLLSDKDLTEAESEKALLLGAQGFMRKPVSGPALIREVERILGRMF